MVHGNLIQLKAKGDEDQYIYGNPNMTYFKSVFKRSSNFAINYSKIPFVGSTTAEFGKEIKFNLPFKSDLLGSLYFKIKFSDLKRKISFKTNNTSLSNTNSNTEIIYESTKTPQFSSYVNGIGYNCIDYIKLYINGILIQTLDSKLIYMINELHNSYTKKKSFYKMSLYSDSGFVIGKDNIENVNSILHVPFFFSKDPSMALPLCSLTHSTIQLVIKFKEFKDCVIGKYNTRGDTLFGVNGYHLVNRGADNFTIVADPTEQDPPHIDNRGYIPPRYEKYNEDVEGSIESFEVFSENIFLDDVEKRMFLKKELTYLIELYHIGNTKIISNPGQNNIYTMDIEGKNPTKYIMWYLQREDVFNDNYLDNHTFDYPIKFKPGIYKPNNSKHILNNATIVLNNADVNDSIDAKFLSDVELYQKFNNSTDNIIYTFSFSLYPNKLEPSGTVNLSRILYKSIKLDLTNKVNYSIGNNTSNIIFKDYSCYYNILVIKDGLGGLMYQ